MEYQPIIDRLQWNQMDWTQIGIISDTLSEVEFLYHGLNWQSTSTRLVFWVVVEEIVWGVSMQESPGAMGVDSSYTSNVPAFLTKLWTLVEDPETNHLICWSAVSYKVLNVCGDGLLMPVCAHVSVFSPIVWNNVWTLGSIRQRLKCNMAAQLI